MNNLTVNFNQLYIRHWNLQLFIGILVDYSQIQLVAQSTGAVEYTDYFSAEGKTPPSMSVLDVTLNNLVVRFQ